MNWIDTLTRIFVDVVIFVVVIVVLRGFMMDENTLPYPAFALGALAAMLSDTITRILVPLIFGDHRKEE